LGRFWASESTCGGFYGCMVLGTPGGGQLVELGPKRGSWAGFS